MLLLFSVTHSLTHTLTHSCIQTLNSKSMKQTYYKKKRKAKSEKRKEKNEKRKAKNKKNLVFDLMNVHIWHELFDGRKTLTHSLSNSLTHSLKHSRINVRR